MYSIAPSRLPIVAQGPTALISPIRRDPAAVLQPCVDVTVIIPAYNEAEMVAATIKSVQQQTLRPSHVIVVDDCSTDGTGDVARALGVTVMCPPANTGSKAGAQNLALRMVDTPFVVALDADTTLAPDALRKLFDAFDRPEVAAACGFVIPRHVETIWERGRYVEYLFAFSFYKQVQDYYGKPIIASGCFSMYRSEVLRSCGGWSTRTMAEDMDLTWTFYQAGHSVRFIPEAVCYPVEPHTCGFLYTQLRRWSHGFVQNVRLHWRGLLDVPYLRSAVGVALWDATIASVGFLALIPLLAFWLGSPWPLLAYVIDGPAILVPVVAAAWSRGETWQALRSLPAFFLIRTVNSVFFLRALWMELAMNRPLLVYEKGH
jgi:biofilm PGA synthesis N-glycosyltransferase PgaC